MTALPRRVSVVVPTCNRPGFLREALASIRAHEGPEYTFEILVGDNGSMPETRSAAEEFGAVYIKVDRAGAGAARNAGLKAATGEYLAFLDDDDVWLPTHLTRHFEIMDADPTIEAVVGQVVSTDLELKQIDPAWPADLPEDGDELVKTMLSGYYPQIGATVARISVRDAIGLFDETLLGDQDWDWQLRIARRRRLAFAKAHCVLFRQRPPGSYDALRLKRIGFARRVFLRHALPERRLWKTPRAFGGAYRAVMQQHYDYFVQAAVSRAERGEKNTALGAVTGALRVFPIRAGYHLIVPHPLRSALIRALAPRPRAST
jgi:glycosyltransferase involved in cell wall biosynthesis